MAAVVRLGVGLVVLSAVFAAAQRVGRSQRRPTRRSRPALRTDLAWWFFVGTIGQWLTRAGIVAVVVVTAAPFVDSFDGDAIEAWTTRQTALSSQPALLQALEVLVLVDLLGYWLHRGFHRYVVASPVFHRWHHTTEAQGLDKNFAGLLPLWDVLFGTLHLPADQRPTVFGLVGTPVPEGFWRQLTYPFHRRLPS